MIGDSNLLQIPEQIAERLGLQPGTSVELTLTADGFEVKPTRAAKRRGADGVWRTHAERMAILDSLQGQGKRLGPGGGVELLIQMRAEDDALELEDEIG